MTVQYFSLVKTRVRKEINLSALKKGYRNCYIIKNSAKSCNGLTEAYLLTVFKMKFFPRSTRTYALWTAQEGLITISQRVSKIPTKTNFYFTISIFTCEYCETPRRNPPSIGKQLESARLIFQCVSSIFCLVSTKHRSYINKDIKG